MAMQLEHFQPNLQASPQSGTPHDVIRDVGPNSMARSSRPEYGIDHRQACPPDQTFSRKLSTLDRETVRNIEEKSEGPSRGLRSRIANFAKRGSAPILKQKNQFSHPEESVGRLLTTLHGTRFWDLKGRACLLQSPLRKEVDDCLAHSNLEKTVYRSYYMHGASEHKASPVVILWGADRTTRRRAKECLKEQQVLENEKYEGWSICTAERDPLFQTLIPLMDETISVAEHNHFEVGTLSFWTNPRTDGILVMNIGLKENLIGTVCGPISISNETFYLTSAHVLTGMTSFDRSLTQGDRPPELPERLFEDSDDDDGMDCCDSEGSSVAGMSANGTSFLTDRDHLQELTTWTGDQNPDRVNSSIPFSGREELVKVIWPTPKVSVRLGSPDLDYALIRATNGAFSDKARGTSLGFEWDRADRADHSPPTGKVIVFTAQRGFLNGSFLPTAVSFNTPGNLKERYFWVYLPDSYSSKHTSYQDNRVCRGDSGAWVFSGKKLYGYVVAGNPDTGAAFVVPSNVLYDDISKRFGTPELTKPPLTSQGDFLVKESPLPVTFEEVDFEKEREEQTVETSQSKPPRKESDLPKDIKSPSDSIALDTYVAKYETATSNKSNSSPKLCEPENILSAESGFSQNDSQTRTLHMKATETPSEYVEPQTNTEEGFQCQVESKNMSIKKPSYQITQAQDFASEHHGLIADPEADPNVKNILNEVYCGSRSKNSIASLKALFKAGLDVNVKIDYYENVLQAASAHGHLDITRLLLDRGADTNSKGGHYGNALQAASSEGHLDIAKILLENGADVNAEGGHYSHALQAASYNGHKEVVSLLLDSGANIEAKDNYGNALIDASTKGHLEVVRLLIENGADVNSRGSHYSNALQAASSKGHLDIAKILLENGADVNAEGGHYSHALQAASYNGHKEVVSLLLDSGANIEAKDKYGNALIDASTTGHFEVVMLLLDKGADVNAKGVVYNDALQAASKKGYTKVVELLLNKGANVNARSSDSLASQGCFYLDALQAASAKGHLETVKLLLDRGADANATGGSYGSAFQAASSNNHEEIVKLLIKRRAKLYARQENSISKRSARSSIDSTKMFGTPSNRKLVGTKKPRFKKPFPTSPKDDTRLAQPFEDGTEWDEWDEWELPVPRIF